MINGDPSLIKAADELPPAPRYVWGWDLARSGWGDFNSTDNPSNVFSLKDDEEARRGWWRSKYRKHLCPIVFPVHDGDDVELLLFNCEHCDIICPETDHTKRYGIELGQPDLPVPPEVEEEAKRRIEEMRPTYGHSMIFGFIATISIEGLFAPYKEKGMHWVFNHTFSQAPYVVVATHGTRWYTEPACGWEFFDDNNVRYKFCHPREEPKRGDYALVRDRWGGEEVRLQTYKYQGRNRRYKVELVEAA